LVVRPRSSKKLSELAWLRLPAIEIRSTNEY
jgi:hypothetical protein